MGTRTGAACETIDRETSTGGFLPPPPLPSVHVARPVTAAFLLPGYLLSPPPLPPPDLPHRSPFPHRRRGGGGDRPRLHAPHRGLPSLPLLLLLRHYRTTSPPLTYRDPHRTHDSTYSCGEKAGFLYGKNTLLLSTMESTVDDEAIGK